MVDSIIMNRKDNAYRSIEGMSILAEDIVTRAEYNHLKDAISEVKADAKEKDRETTKEMMGMRDSKIRTEIKLESIISSQKHSDETQKVIIASLQEIKDKPFIDWSTMTKAWKIGIGMAVIGFVVPYLLGNYMTFVKIFK